MVLCAYLHNVLNFRPYKILYRLHIHFFLNNRFVTQTNLIVTLILILLLTQYFECFPGIEIGTVFVLEIGLHTIKFVYSQRVPVHLIAKTNPRINSLQSLRKLTNFVKKLCDLDIGINIVFVIVNKLLMDSNGIRKSIQFLVNESQIKLHSEFKRLFFVSFLFITNLFPACN